MKVEKVNYERLRAALQSLGFEEHVVKNDFGVPANVFRLRDPDSLIVLPHMGKSEIVRSTDLLSVQTTLHYNGIVPKEDFDALIFIQKDDQLIWTEPTTGNEIEVTAAAHESDGTVIIKNNGTYSPCPVEQLRKVALAEI